MINDGTAKPKAIYYILENGNTWENIWVETTKWEEVNYSKRRHANSGLSVFSFKRGNQQIMSWSYFFPKQFTVGFSLRRQKAGRDMLWPRPGACPPCVRLCPPLVRLVLLALAAPPVLVRHLSALCWWPNLAVPPVLVRHLSALCPPCVVGFGRASRPCPPLVRLVSATCLPCVVGFGHASSPCLPSVRHLSATCPCPPLVRLVLLALAAPPVLVRHLSALCCSPNSLLLGSLLEKKRLPAICSGRVPGACPPCVRHVSALAVPGAQTLSASCICLIYVCPSCVRHVSALCPPCARSLPAQVHHVSSPLHFVRSSPAVGQGHGIVK